MSWNRNDSDPLEIKRRKLAEQERLLAEQMTRLTHELRNPGEPQPEEIKRNEPPLWRLEDDAHPRRIAELPSARKRNLARQRRRDLIRLLVFIAVFLIVSGIVLWFAYARHAE
jgi:hypothetical protein